MNRAISYPWHPPKTRQYLFAVFAAICSVASWWLSRAERSLPPLLISIAFLLATVALLIEQHTEIDTHSHTVRSEGRLFGRFRIWLTRRPIAEFTAVGFQRARGSLDSPGDTVFVGRRRHDGGFVAVRYFSVASGQLCYAADEEARSLAQSTGLPLDEQVA
jgi:hypothetical protein